MGMVFVSGLSIWGSQSDNKPSAGPLHHGDAAAGEILQQVPTGNGLGRKRLGKPNMRCIQSQFGQIYRKKLRQTVPLRHIAQHLHAETVRMGSHHQAMALISMAMVPSSWKRSPAFSMV